MTDAPHPPRWAFTAYGVGLASLHLVLALFDVERAFDLWDKAWPFYSGLIFTTSAAAAVIDVKKRQYNQSEERE